MDEPDGFDIIGDIHGCADMLDGLLRTLGYRRKTGVFAHRRRQAIFIGDLIDRGPQQVETLELVRPMVECGSAQIVMGNHEFNAIAYATPDPELPGGFLRPHNTKNRSQHQEFLDQVGAESSLYRQSIEWFTTMPLFLDLGDLRIVHACWNVDAISAVKRWGIDNGHLGADLLQKATTKGTLEHRTLEVLLKGPEISLTKYDQPPFVDKDGHVRNEARIRWWNAQAETLDQLAEIPPHSRTPDGDPYPSLPDIECKDESGFNYDGHVPVFYGHYWRTWAPTSGQDWTPNTACVDFSAVKGGPLVAYRWSGGEIARSDYVDFPSVGQRLPPAR